MAWVDGTRRNPGLRLSPIDVGPALASVLWGEVTAVLTSATIPPRLVERVGGGVRDQQLNVGSPFDYRAHSLLNVARHLPDRPGPGAEAALHKELALLFDAAGGGRSPCSPAAGPPSGPRTRRRPPALHPLLQGDLPKGRLLEEFAPDDLLPVRHPRLLAGRRHPGPALSLVTLDRLPFPRPDDPLLQARRDRAARLLAGRPPPGGDPLGPGAAAHRTAEDRGAVAVLDPRLATATYRGVLLSTLPPMRRTVERAEVVSFLRRALGGSD